MRVISGIYKGRKLRTLAGQAVRPTSDRLRETLFNILAPVIPGSRFLDLCAGSGAVGIEALSRGASRVTFVDQSRRACSVIQSNLASLGVEDEAVIINRDALSALKRFAAESAQFDIIFFDPPYASEMYAQVMPLLATGGVLADSGIVIAEHRAKTPLAAEYGNLKAYRQVKQGESSLTFFRISEN
ncbi:MAG TPA: 16S rRNA (guanine(966)-N(2))-methyltransferase RsmD [Blastocatellia bacterium]|nr:16S rRNA (guanine(966)-N(2))-methyltransferase RsmD [Blastocatellia bacterium]